MTPFTLPSLQLKSDWTEQADSPGLHGSCPITPGTLSAPMKVTFTPAQRPKGELWDNAYILHRNAYQASTQFAYVTNVTFPNAWDIANCEGYEQDFQLNDGVRLFNWGWQFLFGTGLRIWNRGGTDKWNDVHIPFTFTPDVPAPLVMTFARDATSLTYLTACINGASWPLNISFPAVNEPQPLYLDNAVQLDSKGQGAPISLEVNECTVVGF